MKFPKDVLKLKESKSTVYRNSPAYVFMFIVTGFSVVMGVILTPFLSAVIGTGLKTNMIVSLIIAVLLDLCIVHFMIVRGTEKIMETKNNMSNNIMKYFRINNGIENVEESKLYKVKYSVLEHYNGIPFFIMQFKFGSHKHKPLYTKNFITQVIRYFGENKLEFQKITKLEDFSKHVIWDNTIDKLDKVEDKKFKSFYAKIIKYLKEENKRVRVPTIYFKVFLKEPRHRFNTGEIVDDITRLHIKFNNNIREIHFLTYDEILTFIEEYHYLEKIDIGLSRSLDLVKTDEDDIEVIWVEDLKGQVLEKKVIEENINKYIYKRYENKKITEDVYNSKIINLEE